MKVFVKIQALVLKKSIEVTTGLAHEIIEDLEEAEIIIVDSSSEALNALKENEDAIVLILLTDGDQESGARSLKKAYSTRVTVCHVVKGKNFQEGDQILVPYILTLSKEKESTI